MTGRNLVTLGRPLGASLVLAGLLGVAAVAVGASWAGLSSVEDERDAKADLLERSVAASRRARAEPAAVAADPFVVAPSATLAAARLDADLRALAGTDGLSLLSNRAAAEPTDPAATSGDVGTRIEDQAVLEGRNEAIQALLVRLELGSPMVLVDSLAMEPAEADQAAPGDPQAPRLRLTLTLSAYWRPGQTHELVMPR